MAIGLVAAALATGGLVGLDDRSAAAEDPPEECVISGGHAGPGAVGGGCERGGSGGSGGRGGPPENGTWERTITTGPCEVPEEGEVEVGVGAGSKAGKCLSWTCKKEEPGAEYRRIWSRTETYRGGGRVSETPWHLVDARCIAPPVPSADAVSEWVVHELPKGEPVVQPDNGRTLVGFPTNFVAHTDENPFERGTELAGYQVDVRAVPVTYTWHWGDDTEPFTTDQPGRRWSPGAVLPVVHEYEELGTFNAYVDVGYRATYRVDGGRERPIPEIVTATGGPREDLEVLEVQALLND